MGVRVVVAEDDAKQAELLRRYLSREGYTVAVVHDGLQAIDEIRRERADLLILDVAMPGLDGFDVCRTVRDESDVLVLMLTARSAEDDLLRGLDLGADDYMTKPYSPRELTARGRTLLRRARATAGADSGESLLRVGGLTVDPVRHAITCDGRVIQCTPAEFRLLEAMAAEPERVFTRGRLLEHLHGSDLYITWRTVDMHVMNLRRKIEPDPASPVRLVTIYGVGYKLTDGTDAARPPA